MRQVRQFSVVEVLEAGLRAYVQGARLYLPLVLGAAVLSLAIVELSGFKERFLENLGGQLPGAPPPSLPTSEYWYALATVLIAGLAVNSVLQAGLAYGVVRSLRGGEVTARELWSQALRQAPKVALILVVVSAAIGVGMLFLIVPGVVIYLMLWVCVPAGVVERCGPFRALKRSAELTRGYKGPLFGLMLLYLVLSGTLWVVAGQPQDHEGLGRALAYQLVSLLISGAGSAVVAASYHDLRVLKEGTRHHESVAA